MNNYYDETDLHMTRQDSAVMCGVVLVGFIGLVALVISYLI